MISDWRWRTTRSLARLLVVVALLSACIENEAPPRPNVVLIVVDTLRADRLPFYGAPRDTAPFLDSLARESLVFESAWSPSSWTLPATVSFLTSVHPFQHGVVSLEGLELEAGEEPVPVNCIPGEIETLAEILSSNGYRTFGVVSNLLVGAEVGFDRGFDRFVKLDDEPADRVNAQLALWRDEIRDSEPFFLYLHYFDPHDIYHARAPWFMSYESPTAAGWPLARLGEDDVDVGWIDWLLTRLDPTPERYADTSAADLSFGELEALFGWIKGAYDSEIGFVDQHIREVFESLGLEDAVVIFLADHGEEFYEHGALTHGLNLHVETTRVPLLLRLPGAAEGSRVEEPVSTLDVVPTIRRLLNLPRSAQDQGHDLLAPLPERTVHGMLDRKADQSLDQDHRSATSARYRLVVRGDGDLDRGGDLALYDVASDSWERTDVSSRHPRVVDELRRRIEELALEATPYEHATCLPEPADEKRLERLRAIGYLGAEADD